MFSKTYNGASEIENLISTEIRVFRAWSNEHNLLFYYFSILLFFFVHCKSSFLNKGSIFRDIFYRLVKEFPRKVRFINHRCLATRCFQILYYLKHDCIILLYETNYQKGIHTNHVSHVFF